MTSLFDLATFWWVIPIAIFLIFYRWTFRLLGIASIPEDSIGIINKKFVLWGSHRSLPDGKIIALKGEAGFQADTLAPGLYFGYWPWQYNILRQKFTAINEGYIGVVEARDGNPLANGRVLAKQVECDAFQSARAFLENGGERGPQIKVIPPGSFRINTALFSVVMEKVTEIEDNMVGIVTTKEGRPLATGDIAGKEVPGHNMFQDGQAFLDAGGFKGLQEQVILAGRYFINPRLATVESREMTSVPIASAGVVIAYVGMPGVDTTGDTFKHGNLVGKGQKGVWADPLDPGKYPINPYTHKVECVPTANVVLNWATGKSEAHNLDKNLSTITVRSSDGFTFNLDVSQIIHIPRNDAPKVIARFGNIANLVTQVLEPTIGNYFRNAAQGSDVIDFLRGRKERQEDAKTRISTALTEYNVVAVDTLIGDITPPEALMKTLTDRKIAEQEKTTFETQRMAQETRKSLEQAKAQADTQAGVVAAERSVEISEFNAKAVVKKAAGEAESKTINAKADAEVLTVVGNATAERTTAVGTAEASVIKLKTEAVGQNNYAVIEVGRALAEAKTALVPQIVAGGAGGSDGGNSLVNILLAGLIRDGMKKPE
ncbi:MAG: flotillin family protein [Candidatus Solibacter usitatus]|nr:flotillin family protein [Candidatus Solibacter usitatus]